MAQVKLIETEQPQTFKPVTIQITFETQEQLNSMRSICGFAKTTYEAAEKQVFIVKSSLSDWYKVSDNIYRIIKPFSK